MIPAEIIVVDQKALELEETSFNANMMLGTMELDMIIMFENMGTLNIIGMGSKLSDGQIALLTVWDIYLEDMIKTYEDVTIIFDPSFLTYVST